MRPKCVRRPPGQGEPPQIPAGVGPTDGKIVAAGQAELQPQPLPAQLLALADLIAERFVADVEATRAGGGR